MSVYAVKVGLGWSVNRTAPLSFAIRYFTRPGMSPFSKLAEWSHMFLVFELSDGSVIIHEALGSSGWRAKNIDDLVRWYTESPHKHHYETHWLPIQPAVCDKIYQESCSWIGTRSYDFKMVAAFAVSESVVFRALGLRIISQDDEVFCSEGAAQLVGTHAPEWDLRERTDFPYCTVTPQGGYNEFNRKLVINTLVRRGMACLDV